MYSQATGLSGPLTQSLILIKRASGTLTVARRSTYLGTHFFRIARAQGDVT